MTTILALVTLAFGGPSHIQLARYPAASPKADPQALGGHGTSNNFPKPISDKVGAAGKLSVTVSQRDGRVTVAIRNRGTADAWFPAHDGYLTGHLEARFSDGEAWRPIEYHHWADCGNSRHRVAVPGGSGLTYGVPVFAGKRVGQVRWTIKREGKALLSNTIALPMQESRFTLPAEWAKEYRVHTEWDYAVLAPKKM